MYSIIIDLYQLDLLRIPCFFTYSDYSTLNLVLLEISFIYVITNILIFCTLLGLERWLFIEVYFWDCFSNMMLVTRLDNQNIKSIKNKRNIFDSQSERAERKGILKKNCCTAVFYGILRQYAWQTLILKGVTISF